jgi:hypothetical protein
MLPSLSFDVMELQFPFRSSGNSTSAISLKFQIYIVYMGEKKHDDPAVVSASHHHTLTSILGR